FLDLGLSCDTCICCRFSAIQKATIVTSISPNPSGVTLAIGDGANDIPMLQSAHVGIGITGKEGLAATRAADYAI
ncbi:hypothetical protein BDK51DRAFT_7032, partial [Blyttiomyces helicus]